MKILFVDTVTKHENYIEVHNKSVSQVIESIYEAINERVKSFTVYELRSGNSIEIEINEKNLEEEFSEVLEFASRKNFHTKLIYYNKFPVVENIKSARF